MSHQRAWFVELLLSYECQTTSDGQECLFFINEVEYVWAGILANNIVAPFFHKKYLNSEVYLDMMDTLIHSHITDMIEQSDELNENQLVYQQDRTLPHIAAFIRQFFDDNF